MTTPNESVEALKKPALGVTVLPRNVWAVTFTSFLTDVSSEMIVHLFPFLLTDAMGAGKSVVGQIEGAAEMTASVLKVFSGWFSDRVGRRKELAVAGYAASALSKPFFYLAATPLGIGLIRVAERIGKGVRTAPRDALVADSIAPEHRGLAFGLHRMGDTAGAMVGVLIAAAILWSVQGNSVQLARPTFQTIVLWSLLPGLLSVLVLALGAKEVPVHRKEAPRLTLRGWDPRFYWFLGTILLFTLGNSSDAFLLLRVRGLLEAQGGGLGIVQILLMVASFNLIYTLVSGPAGALSDRIGRRRLIVAGWVVYGVIYLGFGMVQDGVQAWVLYALYGIYYGLTEGGAKALVADLVPAERRGMAYGLYNTAIGLMAYPASAIAGVLWDAFGAPAPFLFGAGLALIASVMLWRVLAGMPTRQERA